jgi:hypothetical protein
LRYLFFKSVLKVAFETVSPVTPTVLAIMGDSIVLATNLPWF